MPKLKVASLKKTRTANRKPTQAEIALRAYHIHLERGGVPGNPLEDWLRAESELASAPAKSRRKSKLVSIAA